MKDVFASSASQPPVKQPRGAVIYVVCQNDSTTRAGRQWSKGYGDESSNDEGETHFGEETWAPESTTTSIVV